MNLYNLNILLQRIKNSNHPLKGAIHKYTEQEQMDISISSGTPNVVSLIGINNLINTESLETGSYYCITNVDFDLYGGTNIILSATSPTTLSKDGFGEFYNPKYSEYSIYDNSGEYSVNNIVIWGGSIWKNLNGTTGNSIDLFSLDENWGKILIIDQNWENYYNRVWDRIEYDIINDFIISRLEEASGNFVSSTWWANAWFFCNIKPIKSFRWGHVFDGETGIMSCKIIDSYFNCLNFKNGSIQGVKLTNYSFIFDLELINTGYIEGLTLTNSSVIVFITIDNSGLYNITLNNNSAIVGTIFKNSQFYNISLNNNSLIISNNFNGCNIKSVILDNNSGISSIVSINFSIENLFFINNSFIDTCTLNNGNFYSITLNNSYLTSLNFESFSLEFLYLFDSNFKNLISNTITIMNLDIKGHSLNINNATVNDINIQAASFLYNTIKYQFGISFSNNLGLGLIGVYNLPYLLAPEGFYIEKLLVDQIDGLIGDNNAIFNMGIEDQGNDAINDITGLKTNLDSRLNCFDISNSKTTGYKSTGLKRIVASVKDFDITGGTINFEIILKNTNYNTNND